MPLPAHVGLPRGKVAGERGNYRDPLRSVRQDPALYVLSYVPEAPLEVRGLCALFADSIRTAKQLNRTSGRILAEARQRPVTIVSEGAEPVVIQSRELAARQAGAEVALGTLASLTAWLLKVEPALPAGLRWVMDLHPRNLAQFRRELPREVLRAKSSGDFAALDDWLTDWKIASEVDADPVLRRRLGLRG